MDCINEIKSTQIQRFWLLLHLLHLNEHNHWKLIMYISNAFLQSCKRRMAHLPNWAIFSNYAFVLFKMIFTFYFFHGIHHHETTISAYCSNIFPTTLSKSKNADIVWLSSRNGEPFVVDQATHKSCRCERCFNPSKGWSFNSPKKRNNQRERDQNQMQFLI